MKRNGIAFALLLAGCLCMGDDMRGITLGSLLICLSAVVAVLGGAFKRKGDSRVKSASNSD